MADDRSGADGGLWRLLAWIGVGLQAIALVFVIWSQKWGGAWTIATFLRSAWRSF